MQKNILFNNKKDIQNPKDEIAPPEVAECWILNLVGLDWILGEETFRFWISLCLLSPPVRQVRPVPLCLGGKKGGVMR